MSKLFLIVCTLLAGFISVSGLLSVKSLSDLPVHLAFLPVTLFLLITSLKQLLKPSVEPEVSLHGRKFQLTILILIFATYISLGLRTIANSAPVSQPSTPLVFPHLPTNPSPSPTTPPLPTLTVFHSDPSVLVNIRSQPTTASTLLTRVSVGTTYPVLDTDSEWYNIQLDASTSGWIHSDYVVTSKTQP